MTAQPRIGPPGSVRVAMSGVHNGTSFVNVFWANLTGGLAAPQADLDAWLAAFATAYETRFLPIMQPSVSTSLARATLFLSPTTVLQSQSARTGVGSGGGVEVDDNSLCQVVSWLSNVYWRGGKPRTYLPSQAVVNVTAGRTLTAGAIATIKTLANGFHTDVNALTHGAITGTQHGFVSFFSHGVFNEPGIFYPITGATVHSRIGTQRRRLGPWTN